MQQHSHPLIVAELCQNHRGDRTTLGAMVQEAAEAGADYAKIQALYSSELTFRRRFETGARGADGGELAIRRPYDEERQRLAGLDLTPEDESWFVEECRRAGIRSMITVFTRSAVPRLATMGFDAVKIASYDCASGPLLRDVREMWRTIFVSTGATFDSEVEAAARTLAGLDYTLLHCVTRYPTPMEELHLNRMTWLRTLAPRVGFSDHTLVAADGLAASRLALALSAEVVERHFTVLPPDATRDGPISISPSMLRELRDFANRPLAERAEIIRRGGGRHERALGDRRHNPSAVELLNRDYYRGRVASKRNGRSIFNWEDVDLDAISRLLPAPVQAGYDSGR